jgi:hypothetical protein
MAYPGRQYGVFFVLLIRKEQDNPFIPLAYLWGRLCKMRPIIVALCSQPVHLSCPFMESDKFFSQVDTFQACLSCTFPCLFLVHCLSVQGHDSEAD